MLIPSPRHTPADLDLWADLEAADRANGARLALARKAERSIAALREFAAAGPCYASVSWGKDSVALADLVARSGSPIPLVYLRAVPVGNPHCAAVRDAFLAAHPGVDYREVPVDYRGIDPRFGPDAVERAKDRRFFAAFRSLGIGRHLSGIRADESGGRKLRMRRWGLASANALAPLGWWSAADVFAYLAARDLPVHPNYAMLGGGRWDRRHLRVDELAGARGDQFGRAAWEREYYGGVLRRLESAGPREDGGMP